MSTQQLSEEKVARVRAIRKPVMDIFMEAMYARMEDAIRNDPTRSLTPWDGMSYTTPELRSRLCQVNAAWLRAAQVVQGSQFISGVMPMGLEDTGRITDETLSIEMKKLLDNADFILFLYKRLYDVRRELRR